MKDVRGVAGTRSDGRKDERNDGRTDGRTYGRTRVISIFPLGLRRVANIPLEGYWKYERKKIILEI